MPRYRRQEPIYPFEDPPPAGVNEYCFVEVFTKEIPHPMLKPTRLDPFTGQHVGLHIIVPGDAPDAMNSEDSTVRAASLEDAIRYAEEAVPAEAPGRELRLVYAHRGERGELSYTELLTGGYIVCVRPPQLIKGFVVKAQHIEAIAAQEWADGNFEKEG